MDTAQAAGGSLSSSRAVPGGMAGGQFASDNYRHLPGGVGGAGDANQGHALPAMATTRGPASLRRCARGASRRTAMSTSCSTARRPTRWRWPRSASRTTASSCTSMAHVETDECGAPEFFSNGTKLLLVGGEDGKAGPAHVEHTVLRRSDIHYPKPRVLSVTQATELGTVYSRRGAARAGRRGPPAPPQAAHGRGALRQCAWRTWACAPADITWRAGVDVLCLGRTKCGMRPARPWCSSTGSLPAEFDYRCKQAGQLASKMRFLTAPWITMLESGAYVRRAAHANRCARLLAVRLGGIPGVRLVYPCQANAVFVQMADEMICGLRTLGWDFYTFIGSGHVRFMCSWATTADEVEALAADVRTLADRDDIEEGR